MLETRTRRSNANKEHAVYSACFVRFVQSTTVVSIVPDDVHMRLPGQRKNELATNTHTLDDCSRTRLQTHFSFRPTPAIRAWPSGFAKCERIVFSVQWLAYRAGGMPCGQQHHHQQHRHHRSTCAFVRFEHWSVYIFCVIFNFTFY